MKKYLLAIIIALSLPSLLMGADASPSPSPTAADICKNATSDKLQSSLADVVNKSAQLAGDAKDFVLAQLPDVIRQLLAWKAFEATVKGIFLAALAAMLFWASVRIFKWANREDEEIGFIGGVFIFGGGWVITFTSFSYLLTAAQIWIAPKVYLIEYAKSMVAH